MWTPSSVSPRGPVYVAIADALARDVERGAVQPGERLPTHRALARSLGVNVVTVTRAYAEAARRGLVEGIVGRGTFVRGFERRSSSPFQPLEEREVDFALNVPAGEEELYDLDELLGELAELAPGLLFAGYRPAGLAEHRAAGAEWLAHGGVDADPEHMIVTSGGQQALAIVLAALTSPGDALLVEELTYGGIKSLASLLHLRLVPVAIDEHGLRPDALLDACRKGNPRLLYCVPNLHNPTGVLLPAERRSEIAAIVERAGCLVVEDDATGFLLESPPPPIARFLPERTLSVASLSKSLAPGLRVGYVHGPEGLFERLVGAQAALSWMTPPLMSELAVRLMQGGRAEKIVAAKRAETRARRALFARHLPDLATPSHPASSSVWVSLPEPWRGEEFAAEARRNGVALSAAESFVVGRAQAPHAARLCLGTPRERADVERGLVTLATLLQRAPRAGRALV